jgi:diguanylate cyclase (GGDEF)-like protein
VLPYRSHAGAVVGTFVNLLDITAEHDARLALAAAREQLWEQARHDQLTGLCNRVPFVERLTDVVQGVDRANPTRPRRRREDPCRRPAVLVCDLDGFKAVNDAHGHRVGDEVLVEVARRLARVVRGDDLLCRYGGDEFLVLCDEIGRDELDALAARIVASVNEKLVIGGVIHQLGVSVGVATVQPGDEADPDELVRRADQAMYRAKSSGGRRAVVA